MTKTSKSVVDNLIVNINQFHIVEGYADMLLLLKSNNVV